MNIFSIDIIALPLLFLPVGLILLATLSVHLYLKFKRRNYLYFSIAVFINALISLYPYTSATGEALIFWSASFQVSTIAILLTVIATEYFIGTKKRLKLMSLGGGVLITIISLSFSDTVSGSFTGFVLLALGSGFLYVIRGNRSNEEVLAYFFITLGVLGFIGHWFPFNGGRFLYSLTLVVLLGHELIYFVRRVVDLLEVASINSITDSLTGLYNKGFLSQKSEQLATNQEIGIVFADIDNFKNLNDTKGHAEGDLVLQQIAGIAKDIIGQNGYACRYGGEEIVLIVQRGNAVEVGKRLCREVEKHTEVTVSVGVALGMNNSQEVIKVADERMYTAKKQGKNQVVSS